MIRCHISNQPSHHLPSTTITSHLLGHFHQIWLLMKEQNMIRLLKLIFLLSHQLSMVLMVDSNQSHNLPSHLIICLTIYHLIIKSSISQLTISFSIFLGPFTPDWRHEMGDEIKVREWERVNERDEREINIHLIHLIHIINHHHQIIEICKWEWMAEWGVSWVDWFLYKLILWR